MEDGLCKVLRFQKNQVLIMASYLQSIFNYIPEMIDANQIAMDDRLKPKGTPPNHGGGSWTMGAKLNG